MVVVKDFLLPPLAGSNLASGSQPFNWLVCYFFVNRQRLKLWPTKAACFAAAQPIGIQTAALSSAFKFATYFLLVC